MSRPPFIDSRYASHLDVGTAKRLGCPFFCPTAPHPCWFLDFGLRAANDQRQRLTLPVPSTPRNQTVEVEETTVPDFNQAARRAVEHEVDERLRRLRELATDSLPDPPVTEDVPSDIPSEPTALNQTTTPPVRRRRRSHRSGGGRGIGRRRVPPLRSVPFDFSPRPADWGHGPRPHRDVDYVGDISAGFTSHTGHW